MSNFLYVLFTIILVLVFPAIERILKNKPWKRTIFYIHIPCALIYIGITIFIAISTHQKDIKLQSLIKQELLIKDLKVNVRYVFKLKNDINKKGGRTMGLSCCAGFVNTNSETDDILKMYTDYKFDLDYPNSKTAELMLIFTPVDQSQILNKRIYFLEKYDLFVLPYEAIRRKFIKLDVVPKLKVNFQIIINGKLFDRYEKTIDVPANTIELKFRPEKGLFKNIEKRYLEEI